MKQLIKQRIKELYEEELEEEKDMFNSDNYLYTRYALKVLVDIYTYDGSDDDNRLIYHDWEVIEPTIELILEKEI